MMTMLVVHVMSNDAKLLIDSYHDIVSYLFWNSVTVSVLKLNAVRSGNRTAAPMMSASFFWNTLLLISFVPFHETDFGADAVCVCAHEQAHVYMRMCEYVQVINHYCQYIYVYIYYNYIADNMCIPH